MTSELQVGHQVKTPDLATASQPVSGDLDGPERFLNRELSWLDFSARLLDLAEDSAVPLLERTKFLAIFANGLDEFFQVRVAGLKEKQNAGIRRRSADGRSVHEQLSDIREKTAALVERQSSIFRHQVLPQLGEAGIHLLDYSDLDHSGRQKLSHTFEREIFPVLTPLAVDPGHPFPYISSLSLNLAVLVDDPSGKDSRFARVKVPPLLPRFVAVGDGERFVPLEQVIAAHLDHLFPEMDIGAHYAFRVTRNADIDLDDSEADDLLAAIEVELRRRRFGRAVRLEIAADTKRDVRDLLMLELELGADDVYTVHAPLDLGQLWAIANMDRPELRSPVWAPMTQPGLATADAEPADLFAVMRERDVLLHHPYDSFATSVEAFISQAAADPDVLAIKQTLYRTSGDAPFVSALARAAEEGKQVAALVELTARFDEQRNIAWARQLEQAGVHVVYGIVGLKTHSKTALVIRREEDGIRRYCHIGTGNYNSDTARVYEDLGLLTSDPSIGEDLSDLFNHLTGFSRPTATRSLVLSPRAFRPWVLEMIAEQEKAGTDGRIAIKVNGLTDSEVIDALYTASRAGVRIELIIRGVCSLRPGVTGMSETISVRSIVGRFLEHSRIYRFGIPSAEVVSHCEVAGEDGEVGGKGAQYFIGSGDLMERNLDRRIEAIVPIRSNDLDARLEDIFRVDLADDMTSWALSGDGTWSRIQSRVGVSSQLVLQELATERARRRRSVETLP